MSSATYRFLGWLTVVFWGTATVIVLIWMNCSLDSAPPAVTLVQPQPSYDASAVAAPVKAMPLPSSSEINDYYRPWVAISNPGPDAAKADLAKIALLQQLAQATNIDVDVSDPANSSFVTQLRKEANEHKQKVNLVPTSLIDRADLNGLPWRQGQECQMDDKQVRQWETAVTVIRRAMSGSILPVVRVQPQPADVRLRNWAEHPSNPWMHASIVPILLQLLQAEGGAVRQVLIDLLASISGPEAGSALAHRAVFDLEPTLRKTATDHLQERPNQEGHDTLVAALRHPWPAAAEHAADALLVLKAKETIPDLIHLLDEPNPSGPVAAAAQPAGFFMRELVRVNHLRNCLLCHVPTHEARRNLAGLVPTPDRSLLPLSEEYYTGAQPNRVLVRADVTYLRQEFSVALPVENPGLWPKEQRYDFLVRTRPATAAEIKRAQANPTDYPQREAVLRALRGLTGKDFGRSSKPWREFLAQSWQLAANR